MKGDRLYGNTLRYLVERGMLNRVRRIRSRPMPRLGGRLRWALAVCLWLGALRAR